MLGGRVGTQAADISIVLLLRLAGLEYRSGANALALLTYSSLYGYREGGGVKGALRFPKSNYSTVVLL